MSCEAGDGGLFGVQAPPADVRTPVRVESNAGTGAVAPSARAKVKSEKQVSHCPWIEQTNESASQFPSHDVRSD